MRGFTLVEVAVAVAVLAVTLLAICGLFQGSSEGMEYFSKIGTADTSIQRVLDKITGDISNASADDVAITPFGGYDAVTVTRAWGESQTATITYTVNGGNELVRISDIPGRGVRQDVVVRNVDAVLRDGVKGFAVTRIGTSDLFRVSLRVNVSLRKGGVERRTFTTTVRTRS